MTTVSVIVPTYRRPHFLSQALASVQAQTMPDYEVLICDNAADPATAQVVAELADERFHYHPREHNLGMLRSAMLGFANAGAPLVMKLDDDDVLLPDALERLTEPFASHPEISLSFGGVEFVDQSGQPLPEVTEQTDQLSGRGSFSEGLLEGGSRVVSRGGVQLAGAVLRADLLDWDAVPDEVATAYDFHLALAATEDSRPVWFTRAPVVRYRIHDGADTLRNAQAQARATNYVIDTALAAGHHDAEALRARKAEACHLLGRALLREGRPAEARVQLLTARSLDPSRPGLRRLLTLSRLPAPVLTRLVRLRRRLAPPATA